MVAVIITLPDAIAVTFPSASTVAIAGSLDAQEISLYVASSGYTVAVRTINLPTDNLFAFFAEDWISIRSTGFTFTSIYVEVATSFWVAVIVTTPGAKHFKFPFSSMSAMVESLEVQTTSLLVVFSG